MEREDEKAVLIEMEGADSDEDVGDAVPTEWSQRGFGEYDVADSQRNEWEYQENGVIQGSKYKEYKDMEAVNDVVKLWSISLRKEFQVSKCSNSVYIWYWLLEHLNTQVVGCWPDVCLIVIH
jgi:hypothetical protein